MTKRKVVFIINNFLVGGVERLIYDLISCLDKDKFNVSIITVMGSGPWEPQFRELGVPIYFAGPTQAYQDNWKFKLRWLVMLPRTLWRVWWWLRQNLPQTILTSLYHADIIGIWMGYWVGIKNRLVIQHDIQDLTPLLRYAKQLLAIKLATRVIAVSKTVREFSVNYLRAAPDQVVVISNSLVSKKFNQSWRTIPQNGLVLGFLGRLESIKGPQVLLEALCLLQNQHHLQPKVVIGGEGSLKNQLIDQAQHCQLRHIQFSGNVVDSAEWLCQIDILVVPSLSEGFCLSALEGLVSKKIVIASDLPAIRELIQDENNGLLFEPQNSGSLADKLYKLFTNSGLQQKISANVLLWHTQHAAEYDIKHMVDQYEQLFMIQ